MLVKSIDLPAINIDDANDFSVCTNHGHGHLGAHIGMHGNVAGVFAHIGHDQGTSMQGDPPSDAFSETQLHLLGVLGESS